MELMVAALLTCLSTCAILFILFRGCWALFIRGPTVTDEAIDGNIMAWELMPIPNGNAPIADQID